MKLRTFYKSENAVVYGASVEGKLFYFFSGFSSAEEAKEECVKLHSSFQKENCPNISKSLARALTEPFFEGQWSEIE